MVRFSLALVPSLVLAACGCGPDASAPAPEEPDAAKPPALPAYDGPELKATVETEASQPPRHTLVVEVNCPTGGFSLALAAYDARSNPREVRYVLTSPASDELVIQAFQMHTARVDLGTDKTPVRVLVSQRQRRNEDAARQPFQLAATVTPPQ